MQRDPEHPCLPTRVLFVGGADFRAPSEKQALRLAYELVTQGHGAMVSVVGDLGTVASENIPVHEVGLHSHRLVGRRLRRLDRRVASDFQPDVIHALYPRGPVLLAARDFARATGAPICVHFEDDEWGLVAAARSGSPTRRLTRRGATLARHLYPPAWPFATPEGLRWIRKHAAGVDAVTPALAELVQQKLGRECSFVPMVAMAPELEPDANPALRLPATLNGRRLVVFTGAVYRAHEEDFRIGLRAIADLQRRGLRVAFLHAGRISPRFSLERWAEELALEPSSAATLGHLTRAQMAQLLERADVLIQPGAPTEFNRLRLPSKLPAYLASGTPTVTFGIGFGEVLKDRHEVLKTHTGEATELADRIDELLEDRALSDAVSAGGQAAARRLFDLETNTRSVVAYYRETMRRHVQNLYAI